MLRRRNSKVVVITDASAGAGRAAAREFARSGADVALLARNGEALERATFVIESQLGPIDVWVNNAMVTAFSPVALLQADEVRRVAEVTYLGTVNATLSALRRIGAGLAWLAWLAAARLSGR